MTEEDETITIPKKVYDKLRDRDFLLECLENGGVDNWEWYGESLAPYYRELRDRERVD